jgi:hypothetical protein
LIHRHFEGKTDARHKPRKIGNVDSDISLTLLEIKLFRESHPIAPDDEPSLRRADSRHQHAHSMNEGIPKSMACTTISKSTTMITLAVLLTLGVIGPIHDTRTAELTGPVSQTEPEAHSQVIPPEPAALLRSYEINLAAYNRMRGRWTVRLEKSKRGEGAEERPEELTDWAVFRDHDRFRLFQNMVGVNGQEAFETLRQGRQMVSLRPDESVFGRLQPSAQDELDQLSGSPCSPCYGIIDSEWIPDFLRKAKISVQLDKLQGNSLYRLRGLTMDAKIELWIDPSLNYAARRIRFDKRASAADSTVRSRQFEVTGFRQVKGHYVVSEATTTLAVGPQPVSSPMVVDRTVKGKRVKVNLPAKDENGDLIMDHRQATWKITLRDFDFDPSWTSRDFQFSRPIIDGTRVAVQGHPDTHFVWRDGRVVLAGSAGRDQARP